MIRGSFGGCIRLTPTETVFRGFLRKVTIFEKIVVQKISEIALPEEKVIFVFVARCALPFQGDLAPLGNSFPPFFRKICFFLQNGKRRQKRGKTSGG